MDFNIDDEIQFTKAVKLRCVLQAKKGQKGIIKNIDNNKVTVELTNGNMIEAPIEKIELYKKKEKFNINTATNEELLEKFETLVAHEWQTINTHTKSYEKIIRDRDRVREELLKRLNK